MEEKMRHLEIIQGVINRMANSSFALKGWAVTLVTALFALATKETNKMNFLLAYVPIIVFWLLDSYYLYQERLYRALYGKVRTLSNEEIDFDMNVNQQEFKSDKNCYCSCVFSKTELWFYVTLAAVYAFVMILGSSGMIVGEKFTSTSSIAAVSVGL